MMKRKKTLWSFCIKVILMLVILFGVDRLIGSTFVSMKDVGLEKNPENMWLKTAYTVEKVDAEVIVIGSSKASHHYVTQLLEDSLGMSAYNCGQDGCFFLYQNCVINMILDRYTPKMILWDIQPGSFISEDHTSEYQNMRYLSPYYPANRWVKSYIDSESIKMRIRMMSGMFAYNSKILNYLFPLLTHNQTTQKGYIPLPTEGYDYPIMNGISVEKDVEVNREYIKLLDETMKRCQDEGVKLIMCISPEYMEKSDFSDLAVNEIGDLSNCNHIVFADFFSDNRFMTDSSLFKDASHLNDNGAKLFTKKVLKYIEQPSRKD